MSKAEARIKSPRELRLEKARLLDTETFAFIEEDDMSVDNFPACAILSHRWSGKEIAMRRYKAFLEALGGEELIRKVVNDGFMGMDNDATIAELSNVLKKTPNLSLENSELLGAAKILRFCHQADRDGHRYAWVDTCCIDKTDIAVTSNAIGSMWEYYSHCARCYIYLEDVTETAGDQAANQVRASTWFSRGWTLQEMLASGPRKWKFYNKFWRAISFPQDQDALSIIQQRTKISQDHLKEPTTACIAVRMSWLSGRRTSLPEDMAYCMLGIFGVQLAVDYQEGGEKAFRRLQMEIIKDPRYAKDESIFAWTGIPEGREIGKSVTAWGLLAPWPSHFTNASQVTLIENERVQSWLQPRLLSQGDGVTVQIPAEYRHMNNGADRNIAEARRSNEKEVVLNVRDEALRKEAEVSGQSGRRPSKLSGLFGKKAKAEAGSSARQDPPPRVAVTLIRNPDHQWRRKPSQRQSAESRAALKHKHTMPLAILQHAERDYSEALEQDERGGFWDGMREAIDARKAG